MELSDSIAIEEVGIRPTVSIFNSVTYGLSALATTSGFQSAVISSWSSLFHRVRYPS